MANPDLMSELREWQRRTDEVKFHGETTIYVTPEEMVMLRATAALEEIERDLLGIPKPPPTGALGQFVGTPVVVDREKAAEQRARLKNAAG